MKSDGKTDALIRELAFRAEPVEPIGHPASRFGAWAVLASIWTAASVIAVGVRTDLATASRAPAFAWDLVLPLAVAIAAPLAAFAGSVPGHHGRRWALIAAAAMGAWLLVVVEGALGARHGQVGAGVRCLRNLAVFSLPPTLLLYRMLRRAAPLDRGVVGMLATMGMSALAHVGTRFVCHNDGALHVLVWHCSFVLLLGGLGILLGRAVFK